MWMENQLVIGNDISCYSESCKPDQCANLVIKAWSTKHWWMWENQKCLWPNYPVCVSFPLQPLIVKPEQQFRLFYRKHSKSWNWLKQTKLLFPLFSCTFFFAKGIHHLLRHKKICHSHSYKKWFPRKLGYLDKKSCKSYLILQHAVQIVNAWRIHKTIISSRIRNSPLKFINAEIHSRSW